MKQPDKKAIDVSIILVNYNTANLLPDVLDSLQQACLNLNVETVIVDNASKDNSAALIKDQYPNCRLMCKQKNLGFGRANNLAIDYVSGRNILLLNTDAFVSPDSLSKTIQYMDEHPLCGIVGAKLVGRDGLLQPSCRYFPTPWNLFLQRSGLKRFFPDTQMIDDMNWDHATERACDWVPGCFYLVRPQVIEQIGLFDPRYFLYYEEVDHCFAAKQAGWEVHYYPHTSVIHLGGESAKKEGVLTENGRQLDALQIESELLYFRKNHGLQGLLLHCTLSTLADVINLIKGILKMQVPARWVSHINNNILFWQLFFRTRGGLFPTR